MFLTYSVSVFAEDAQEVSNEPLLVVEKVATNTFQRIKVARSSGAPESLESILEQELMRHVNYQFAAFKVLGKYVRNAPRESLHAFVEAFRGHLVASYFSILQSYDGQEVVFKPVTVTDEQKEVTVIAVVLGVQRPDINLSFKLRKFGDRQRWMAYDIMAEGVSMIFSNRNEFEPHIRRYGIQSVVETLIKQSST